MWHCFPKTILTDTVGGKKMLKLEENKVLKKTFHAETYLFILE